jgi:Tol biopolymer transport system component
LTRFSIIAALVLFLLGVLPGQSSLVHAQSGPNGKIAFVSNRNPEGASDIYTMNADGSNVTRLTNLGNCDGPVWSPDGNRIAFTSLDADGNSKIYRINANGTALSLLYIRESSPAKQLDPKWSPDGTKIAFTHESQGKQEIYVMDATTGYTLADYSFDVPFPRPKKDTSPVWSPDGTKIAYLRDVGNFSLDNEIFVIDINTQVRQQVTSGGNSIIYLSWSPNSNRLAFTRGGTGKYSRVHIINADGTGLISPTPDLSSIDGRPSWSPDGTRIAFEQVQLDNSIYLGSNISVSPANIIAPLPVFLVPGTEIPFFGSAPSWSPDGSKLTFAAELDYIGFPGLSEIYTVEADGDNSARLTNNADGILDFSPAWQPTQVDDTPVGTNVTVNYGQIKLTFENVTARGQTSIQLLDANSFSNSLPPGYSLHFNHAYEITTTAAFTGPVTISFELLTVAYPEDLAVLRVLHRENGVLVDRTILAPDQPAPQYTPNGSTIAARVTSLSPFVMAKSVPQDQTAPTVTATTTIQPNGAGWYNSDTTVLLRASDDAGGSGIESISYTINGGGGGGGSDFTAHSVTSQASLTGATVVNGSEVDIPVTTEGTTTITYIATDLAGNSSPEQTITLKLDKTAPVIAITAPANNAAYTQNQAVAANYACSDNGSNIASCVGTKPSGSNINTSSTGAKSFVVTATDNAGNMTEKTVSYTVQAAASCATDVTNRIRFDSDDLSYDKRTRRYKLTVTLTNKSATAIQGPVSLVIDYLSDYGLTLSNKSGVTICGAPLGSPYINVSVGSDGILKRNESATVTLLSDPTNEKKPFPHSSRVQPRVLAGNGTR